MRNRVKTIKIKALKALSEAFGAFSFFIQGRMDIDPKSLWFDPAFNAKHGGFFVSEEAVRALPKLPMHDLVRRDMLLLLCRSIEERNVAGAVAELGVYRGETAKLFHYYLPERKLYLLDTFEGFPKKAVQEEKDATGFETGVKHFSDTAPDLVIQHIAPLNDNIVVLKGFFPDSVTSDIKSEKFALVHLDADLYQPTKAGLEIFYPKLNPGGIIIVHDYNAWLGARKAVDEYCSSNQLIPIPMPDKSGSCIIVKNEF